MPDRLATLLPYPVSVRALPGTFPMGSRPRIEAGPAAQEAAEAVSRAFTAVPWPSDAVTEAIATEPVPGPVLVDTDGTLPPEGHRLLITPDRITVTAADPAGAFYAAQTIRQLLPDEAFRSAPVQGPAWTLPCAQIEDAPALSWRGGHLDTSRHSSPSAPCSASSTCSPRTS